MGTFIKNYIEFLPFEKIVLFGGFVPFFYMGTSLKKQKLLRYFLTAITFGNVEKRNRLIEKRLKKILIQEQITCVVAEYLITGASVTNVCEELNIPIVANVLGYEVQKKDALTRFRKKYEILAHAKISKKAVPVAKHMIPILESFGFNEADIIYSPLGARAEFFEVKPDYAAKTFVAVGRFVDSKAPHLAIKSFHKVLKNVPDAKLIMGGTGELLEECQQLVSQLKIENSVEFVGWITQEEEQKLFKKCSVFIQHSRIAANGDAEGTPVVILEASAASLPIISTRHGGIVDIVKEGETGFLVEENDWEAMAEKMELLITNNTLMETMGANAKSFVAENFSMKNHIEKLTETIQQLNS